VATAFGNNSLEMEFDALKQAQLYFGSDARLNVIPEYKVRLSGCGPEKGEYLADIPVAFAEGIEGPSVTVKVFGNTIEELEEAAFEAATVLFGPDRNLQIEPKYHVRRNTAQGINASHKNFSIEVLVREVIPAE
jgi:hypothetical protein